MKNSIIIAFIVTNISSLIACPTCVGKITSATVPFFSTEFYQPGKIPQTTAEYGSKEFKKLLAAHKEKK